jgi:hypothetical protein
MLKPNLPEVGATITIMGIKAMVLTVEPESDWWWRIELSTVSALGSEEADEVWSITVPTDYHTTTGRPVVEPQPGSEAIDDLPSLKCAWDRHGECRDTTCGCDCHHN